MRVMLVTRRGARTRLYDLRRPGQLLALMVVLAPLALAVVAASFGAGVISYHLAHAQTVRGLEHELAAANRELAAARDASGHVTAAFARQLGELRARLLRLDALGERLVKLSGLEDGEFDFGAPASLGGPAVVAPAGQDAYSLQDLAAEVEETLGRSDSRGRQLHVLAELLQSRWAREQSTPDGLPVRTGWISSYFGRRADPFTGHRAHHQGVDIAGREGSPIEATAAGIVVYAGRRSGYGNLVEIDHGGGLVTRYGHNDTILTEVGATVSRGDVIATMGQTGRATGPHLHFEVLRNGRAIDPLPYIVAD